MLKGNNHAELSLEQKVPARMLDCAKGRKDDMKELAFAELHLRSCYVDARLGTS